MCIRDSPYPFATPKISSTSTADSCALPSAYAEDLKDDPELLRRFGSLNLDDLDYTAAAFEGQGIEPRRHASELIRSGSGVKVRPKLSHGPLQGTANDKGLRSPRNIFSSTKDLGSSAFPPGLRPLMGRNPPYAPYSSNNVTQFIGGIPLCTMPQYIYQPEILSVPMVYGYYSEVPRRSEPRRYFSSKKQLLLLGSEPSTSLHAELSEKSLMSMKMYEKTGDYKKLEGEICSIAKVQRGSRFLQKELDKADSEFLKFILNEVSSYLIRIDCRSVSCSDNRPFRQLLLPKASLALQPRSAQAPSRKSTPA
eukprot:TRINITY_DN7901_c0_g1_i1.p1 TRINITY_DN7901_c0_g1~~TRINITY_DN7901_c0_g1_i1.p1  ORF type:complete len:309 (+),score=21.01 TRINITY_DN7901_c0_g1_i1:71-997(+)